MDYSKAGILLTESGEYFIFGPCSMCGRRYKERTSHLIDITPEGTEGNTNQ